MFHKFPQNDDLRAIWVAKCCRQDKFNIKNARICSIHFTPNHYERDLKSELLNYEPRIKILKKDAVPTENLPKKGATKVVEEARITRREQRENKKLVQSLILQPITSTTSLLSDGIDDNLMGNIIEDNASSDTTRDVSEKREDNATQMEINVLKSKYTDLKTKIATLEAENIALKQQVNYIDKIFTPGQIQKMKKSIDPFHVKRVKWTFDDISKALCLRSSGPRAYRHLLKLNFPLPAVSTLQKWSSKIIIKPGMLCVVINILKNFNFSKFQKVCVLLADEMKVNEQYEYDKKNDTLLHPAKCVQVIQIRGLFENWKQPIFYQYDCKLTKELIYSVVTELENIGYNIVGVVCDLGGGNRGLWKSLNVSEENSHFTNPVTGENIYVFGDAPHLIKLLRNHFLDSGFLLEGKLITKLPFLELMDKTKDCDLNIAYKITDRHMNVKGAERQKVKLATQLFSHTNSCALKRLGNMNLIESQNWEELSDFIKLVNDWFDIFNSKLPRIDPRKRMSAYGLELENQSQILRNMESTIQNMRVNSKKNLMPFQKGILMSIKSLEMLFEDMRSKYNIKYLITNRLNQDILEGFFSIMRYNGGLHDHPSPLEFKYRLRNYILGRNEGIVSTAANVDDPSEKGEITIAEDDFNNSVQLLQKHEPESVISRQIFNDLKINGLEDEKEENGITEIEHDGLESVGGFIVKKFRMKYPELGAITSGLNTSYVDNLSEGRLYKPSKNFMQTLSKLWNTFQNNGLSRKNNFIKYLLQDSHEVNAPEDVKTLFFRTVMFFSIRRHNKERREQKERKRKYRKTVD